MASAYRRVRDGKPSKVYTIAWTDADGTRRTGRGYADYQASMRKATKLETDAGLLRDGMVSPAEVSRREATARPLVDHVADYRDHLLAKGGTVKHAKHVAGVLTRLLADARVARLADLTLDRVQAAVGRMRESEAAPRTINHAIGSVKAFATWLADTDRIEGHKFKRLALANEEVGRKRERRALTPDELARLIDAAERGPLLDRYPPTPRPGRTSKRGGDGSKGRKRKVPIDGPGRAMIYRLAAETGFRAEEIRSLMAESLRLDSDPPVIVCEAAYTKNGRRAEQPIRREFAERLRAWIADRPLPPVPEKTAYMLRLDLKAAGIPYRDERGRYVDFHSLRGTFVTNLIRGGANIKVVQALARHSTPSLTLGVYGHADDSEKSRALDGLPRQGENG